MNRDLHFISHRITSQTSGGERCNEALLCAAREAGFTLHLWEGAGYPRPWRNPLLMNFVYLAKVIRMIPGSLLLLDMDFHARYVLALLWAEFFRNARIIGILYHYNYWTKTNPLSRIIHYGIERFVSRHCDAVITISRFSQGSFRALAPRPVPSFILTPFVKTSASDPSVSASFDPGYMRLLFVGSVEERKNLHTVIEALRQVSVPFHFDVVGLPLRADYLKRLSLLVRAGGMEDWVTFHGRVDDLEPFYRRATVFVLVSYMEGFGMVYGEAMRFGLPIIATNRGAVPELVEDGRNGILCDPDQPGQIAEAIGRLSDGSLWSEISRNNLEKFPRLMDREQYIAHARSVLGTLQNEFAALPRDYHVQYSN